MNRSVYVYGASDDLVEIDGAIHEEFSSYGLDEDSPGYLAFNDGTVLEVRYDGRWRITPVQTGVAEFSKLEATDDEGRRDTETLPDGLDVPAYSDLVTLTLSDEVMQSHGWVEGLKWRWVVYGTGYCRAEQSG